MFDLMDRHYENVVRRTFESDLAEKRWVVELRSQANGELCGFSTQTLLDANVDGRPVKALFSGDTIIDPRYDQPTESRASAWCVAGAPYFLQVQRGVSADLADGRRK